MTNGIVHDFDLEIGRVMGLPIYWYGAVYTVGFLGVFAWFAFRRHRLGWSLRDVLLFSIAMATGIMLGGRIFDILVYELDYYRGAPWQALDWWRGGMASHGVMLGGMTGIFLFCRATGNPFVKTADELSVPAAFVMGVGRLGNFIEGGVIGSVTWVPWAFIYPNVEGPRHPVALYDGGKNLLLVPILALVLRRFPAGRGVAMGAFLVLYAGLRFLIDFFRDYEGGWLGIGQGQYFNIVMALVGVGCLVWAFAAERVPGPKPPPDGRPAGIVLPLVFVALCLYPLGIPTSWTRVNIEEKRQQEQPAAEAGPTAK
ncbi:prolipoprotein diacylglyceryl transferase [Prosthecomicrobium sp. N25]|uniref:prolipoprotein diacylglyceryl transferase n=1 Tax=Prosthecomicrobium sp. N25 TaxID=3129254 RepID=UPI00307741AF